MSGKTTIRVVHLTDPHLSRLPRFAASRFLFSKRFLGALSWSRRQKHHLSAQLSLLVRAIRAEDPDLIICTGDLVQIGTEAEVLQAREWLDDLSDICQVILVPGNHDCYQRDSYNFITKHWAPYFFCQDQEGYEFPTTFRFGNATFIGLSSVRPEPFWSARGVLGERQLTKLESVLDESKTTFRCVFLHHPPIPGKCATRKSLRDAAALSELLEKEKVEMVLHGHVHCNQIYSANEYTRVFATASASNVAVHAPASYRIFDIRLGLENWDVLGKLKVVSPSGKITTTSCAWESK